jgi:hypothetical protein
MGYLPAVLQHRVLESLGTATRYTDWLVEIIRPHLGDDPIEIGAGLGDHARRWLDDDVPRITLTERDPELVAALRRRFDRDSRVAVRELDLLEAEPGEHSAAVLLNVLEHIDDDVAALRRACVLAERVVVLVPAFPFAMSRFDREIGHHRRYTKPTLSTAAEAAGLTVDVLDYVNALGLIGWTVGMKFLRLEPREGRVLSLWDRHVVPTARRLEEARKPPFGQSLLLVAH